MDKVNIFKTIVQRNYRLADMDDEMEQATITELQSFKQELQLLLEDVKMWEESNKE